MQYKPLTPKQKKVLEFITNFVKKNDFSPSFEEIASHFKLKSMSSVHQYITTLAEKGYLEREDFKQRSIKPVPTEMEIPLLGNISFGEAIKPFSIPSSVTVPKAMIAKKGVYYGLQVKGKGWPDQGFFEGDSIVLKNQKSFSRGAHVLGILPTGEVVIKKIHTGKVTEDLEVRGRIVGVIRNPTPPKRNLLVKDAIALDQIITGDVLDVLRAVPSNSVHLAITSPPYNVGISYDTHNDRMRYQEYLDWLEDVWRETKRTLVPGGRFALNIAPTGIKDFVPIHHDFISQLRKLGMKFRTEIIWYKQTMLKRTAWGSFKSPANPHIIPSWEYVLVFSKERDRLDGNPENADITKQEFIDFSDGFWSISPETRRNGHPAPFPEELIYRLIKFYSYKGNTVLDMFGGTGTVALVAKKNGRHFIHIDISEHYNDVARKRIEGITVQFPMFSTAQVR